MHSISRRALVALLIASLVLGTIPTRGGAVPAASARGASTVVAGPSTDSAVGVIAAMACGAGVKLMPVILPFGGIGWVAAVAGSCLLMIVDAMGEKD